MRKLVHRLVPVGEVALDGRLSLYESSRDKEIRFKDRVTENGHRLRDPLVIMLVRKRGRLSSCVVGMLTRMMVTAVRRSGTYATFSFSSSL